MAVVHVGRRQQEGGSPPRKPLPRKKIPADLRSLARGHTELCIKVLAGLVSQEAVPPAARVSAVSILLDRGWGRAPQAQAAEDGDGGIEVTIRHIVDSNVRSSARPMIEASALLVGKDSGDGK